MRSSLPFLLPALLLALPFLGCGTIPTAHEGATEPSVLPTRDCGGLFLAEVELDGEGPFTFLLDTGASVNAIDDDLRAGGEPEVRVSRLACGAFVARDLALRVHDLGGLSRALGDRIDGVLGQPAFVGWIVTFDYPLRQVRAARGALPAPDGLEVFGSVRDEGPYLELRVGERHEAVLLDTGANGGLELTGFDGLLFQEGPRATAATQTVDGVLPREQGRLAHDLTFGVDVLRRPIVGRARGTAIAGAALLRHFALTVDAARARFALTRANEDPIRSPSARGFGLGFRTLPEGLQVIHVMPGGPGATAGILRGDLIEAIAGRPAGLRSCEGLLRRGESAQPVPLRVRRGAERFEVGVAVGVLVR